MLDFYRQALDATPDAILISNEDGTITFVNHQASVLLGYEKSELINQCIDNLLPQRFRAAHVLLRKQFIEHPSFRPMGMSRSVLALCNDGSEIPVEICLSFMQINKNILVVSALRDVSKQKKIESDLRISEQRFRLMADASPSMIWITDLQGTPSFVNKTWLDFTGISLDEALTYEGWNQAIHDDDKESAFRLYYKKTINGKHHITTEYRLKRADGNWRWILDNGVPFYDEHHVFCGYIGSAIDITERKQAEADFRIAATAFESHEAMVITDANTVILRVNRNFSESTGYSSDELVGHQMNLLKSGKHDANFYKKMWESINEIGMWQGEVWDKRKTGELFLKWITITAVKDANNVVTNYVGTHIDITERKKAQDEVERLAFYDPLTTLPNRRLLLERLNHAARSSNRSRKTISLMFIDMDNFKTLNDTLGHEMGDMLLKQVAERLCSCVRKCDTVARLGGDEFVVMLEELSEKNSEAVSQTTVIAEKILFELNQNYKLGSHNYHSTPSIGIALFDEQEKHADELLKQADIAMYQAKAAGRNAIRFFNPQMQATISKRFLLEEDLYRALTEKQFTIYYQLQTCHNKIIGAEALIRWIHPDRGTISPMEFIPLAEESGLILLIGQWFLETVCHQIKIWASNPLMAHLQISMNVSAKQFRHANFVEQIKNSIELYQIKPNRLKLEITESLLFENIDDVIVKMTTINALGVSFSMDDFGTGYSSLSYLTKLPLHQLKIDQSFIHNIGLKDSDAAIVQAIIAMTQSLGIEVIAEGVETEEQREFLELHNCSIFQGFLFGRPIGTKELELLLESKFS